MPSYAAAAAWQVLTRRPYAVLGVAGFVAVMAIIIGGLEWVPLALVVALITAAAAPAIDDQAIAFFEYFDRSGSRGE